MNRIKREILILIIIFILNIDIYFDTCWKDGTCKVDTRKVIELIKEYAVTLPLNDVAKREALLEKYDYDVNKVIEIRRASEIEEEEKKKASERRAGAASAGKETSTSATQGKVRRVSNTIK